MASIITSDKDEKTAQGARAVINRWIRVRKGISLCIVTSPLHLKECEYLKKSIKKVYPNLADVDLNEEVFAAALGKHLSGHDLGMFLNGELQSAK